MIMDSSRYKYFPCLPEHVGSQKCHVSRSLYVLLKAKLGQACWVSHCRKKYLCTIWPKNDQQEKYVYLDQSVEYPDVTGQKLCENSGNFDSVTMFQSKTDVLETVTVDVVLSDYSQVPYFKQNIEILVQAVKELLHFTVVSPSCIVNAEMLPLGKFYGIKYVVIASRNINKFSCGTVKEKTALVITSVESIDRYQQRCQSKTVYLGGMLHAKSSLREMVETLFHKQEVFRQLRMQCPRSVLLRGPPGTGKSSLVKLVAFQYGAHVLTITGPELIASRPGETEENLRKVFHKACMISEEGPCILFIDEIDSFCSKKGKGSSNEQRVLSQLLSLLDEVSKWMFLLFA